jgi:predicted benzoate:H+ symporter BenE
VQAAATDRQPRSDAPARIGGLLEPAGGVLIVASAFLPWVAHGLGSSVDLHDLGDLLLGGTVSAVIPRWVGLVAYLIPIVGAALIMGSSIEGARARRWTAALAVAALVLVLAAALMPLTRHAHPWLGQLVAGLGVLMACIGVALRRPTTSIKPVETG